ncbi:MAG: ATP-binding protein [Arcicella sp.]|nr:ATP-binding protein [Arcicella sp.]
MLVEFSVSNFRSIKEMQTLSFLATAVNEHEDTHVFQANEKTRLLKSIGVYGANSSGKSNLVKAIGAMLGFIKAPFDEKYKFQEQIQPFKYNTATRNEGTFFQIIFILDKKTYRYGFVYEKGIIKSEWLFGTAEKNEVKYFTREEKNISIIKERFGEGVGLDKKTKKNNLFLNVVYEFSDGLVSSILEYLADILVIKGVDKLIEDNMLRDMSMQYLGDEKAKIELLQFIKVADEELVDIVLNDDVDLKEQFLLGLGVNMKDLKNAKTEEDAKQFLISQLDFEKIGIIMQNNGIDGLIQPNHLLSSKRNIFNEKGEKVGIDISNFDDDASEGTRKLFSYAGRILECINHGGTIIIDEFGSTLHTLLTKAIINMFNSEKNKFAQLCFITHDTNLLDKDLLRRDQLYFTEKNSKAETSIYSLAEIKGIRNDASFEKDYIRGKYGAIPFVKPLNSIFG